MDSRQFAMHKVAGSVLEDWAIYKQEEERIPALP